MEEKQRGVKIIGIAGDSFMIGKTALALRTLEALESKQKPEVVLVHNRKEEEMIEINGEKYEPIEQPQHNSLSRKSMLLASLTAIATMYGGSSYNRKLNPSIDIVKEYELIQRKESELSRWERDRVVSIFESKFRKVS